MFRLYATVSAATAAALRVKLPQSRGLPRFHPRLPRASAEHTPGCAVYEPGRAGCLLTRCPVRVPPRQISESVCLDLGIIAGASVSVQWWVCDLGRDMTLMFDEACCWWIWCSCRPLAGSRCSCLLFTQM